jgi:uncharacterized membrane protein HdeD (DUF308 family)
MVENQDGIKQFGGNMKWLGILTALLGLGILASPLLTGITLVVIVGFLVLAGGVIRLFAAFRGHGTGFATFLTGILTILCGLVLVLDPVFASGVLTILIAVYLVFDGGAEMFAAWALRPNMGWGWLMATGVMSLLLGILIWRQFPLSGAWALGFVLGFKMLLIGLTMAGVGRVVQREGT